MLRSKIPAGFHVQKPNESEAKFIFTSELEKLCDFTWTEDLVIDSSLKQKMEEIPIRSEFSRQYAIKIKHMKDNPDFYASKITLLNRPHINFYSVAREVIPKGQLVARYIGELFLADVYNREHKDHAATKIYARNTKIRHVDHPFDEALGVVDPEKFGNVARFLPHLPTEAELSLLKDSDLPTSTGITLKDIATENLKGQTLIDDGMWVGVFEASEDIPCGCPIGSSYGPGYWLPRDNNMFYLLSKQGELVMLVKYNKDGKIVKAEEPILSKDKSAEIKEAAASFTTATVSTVAPATGSPIHTRPVKCLDKLIGGLVERWTRCCAPNSRRSSN